MAKAVLVKGLGVRVPDAIGSLQSVLTPLAEARVNIDALIGGSVIGEGQVTVVLQDVVKAVDVLKNVNIVPWETDVVAVEVNNEPGALAEVVSKVTQAGVNIRSTWVTTGISDALTRLYLITDDNTKVLNVIV